MSGRKGVLPPESAAPTSTSSIDAAVLLDRSSSCCVRAVRAQASSSVAYGGTVWGFGHNVHQFIDLTVVASNTTVNVTHSASSSDPTGGGLSAITYLPKASAFAAPTNTQQGA